MSLLLPASLLLTLGATAEPLTLAHLRIVDFATTATASTTSEHPHWGPVEERWWTQGTDAFALRVAELRLGPRAPRGLTRFLAHWRTTHGCTAKATRPLPPLTRAGVALPQLTFEGSCEGGDVFIIHVVLVGDTAYELHADRRVLGGPAPDLRQALETLLTHVEVLPADAAPPR